MNCGDAIRKFPGDRSSVFRNVAAHGYAGLNLQLIWEIIETDLDELLSAVEAELEPQRPQRKKRKPGLEKHPPS
jgi:hypothetical protein